jgi:hypothetical protein
MKLSRTALAFYVGLIFLSGLVLGAFGHRLYTVNSVGAVSNRPNPDEWRKRYMSEMESRLKLSSEQAGQLNTILDETRASFQQVRERMKPEMDAIRDGQAARIRAMLNDTQRHEYEKMRREREENMKKAGGPGGPPPGH